MENDYFVSFFSFIILFSQKRFQIADKYVNISLSFEMGGHLNSVKPINGFILKAICINQKRSRFQFYRLSWSIVKLSNFKSIFHILYFFLCKVNEKFTFQQQRLVFLYRE